MKITISDTSFHDKVISRYRQGKSSRFVFPTMFFLRSARGYLYRIIDRHVHLNFQIHNKYMDLSTVLLEKFHEMKAIFSGLVQEKHAKRGVLYRLNNTLTLLRIHELMSGLHEINKISSVDATTAIFKKSIFSIENYHSKKLVSFRKKNAVNEKSIFNFPMIINQISNSPTIDTIISMDDDVLNNSIKANNSILHRIVYSQIFNHLQTTTKNFFSSNSAINIIFSNSVKAMSNTIISSRMVSGRTFYYPLMATTNNYSTQKKPVNYWDSNHTQIGNNIFSYTRILNDVSSLNYLRIINAQTLYGGNNFTVRFIGNNFKFDTKTIDLSDHIKDTHKRIAFFPARSAHFGFATHLKPEVQNGINGSNNKTAGVDIVFRKPQIENKITGEKRLQYEKTISAKIRADKQIKNLPPQMLQGEISLIANKVYKLLERRLLIEKEKRGVHIIG